MASSCQFRRLEETSFVSFVFSSVLSIKQSRYRNNLPMIQYFFSLRDQLSPNILLFNIGLDECNTKNYYEFFLEFVS